MPVDGGRERAFDKAVFRDGFDRDDAFLLLQGANISAPLWREGLQGNSIVRYTELGSLLLFHNTQIQGSWARNVVRVSRGEHDPQSPACLKIGAMRGREVSAIQSLQEQNGGAAWERTILRRRRGYFIVIDKVTAHHDDDYNIACQWRCYQPGSLTNDRRFVSTDAMNGVRMHIVSSRPHETQIEQSDRDGSADPLLFRQVQDCQLKESRSVTFMNVLYAASDKAPRSFDVRPAGPTSVIVKGKTDVFDELALVGAGSCGDAAGFTADARVVYVSEGPLCVLAAKRIIWPGTIIQTDVAFNMSVSSDRSEAVIENATQTPIILRLAGSEWRHLRIDNKQVLNEMSLAPGRHALAGFESLPESDRFAAALQEMWRQAEPPAGRTRAARRAGAESPVRSAAPVWKANVFRAPPHPYHGIKLQVESETPIDAKTLVDRSHHRWSPDVGLPANAPWAIELKHPMEVESIRLVGGRGTKYKEGVVFDVEIYAPPELAGAETARESVRRIPNVRPVIEPWYSQMEQYMYTFEHPVMRIPINDRTARIRLRAQEAVSALEARVFVNDGQRRAKARLWTIKDANGTGIVAVGHDEVVRLDPSGEILWRWKADSKIISSFVEFAAVEKCWLIGIWPVSNRFALLDGAGELKLDPAEYEKDPQSNASVVFSGSSRPATVMLWERHRDRPGDIMYFPHYGYGQIHRADSRMTAESLSEPPIRGGKAALRIPDINGDGREDLFVVGRYENANTALVLDVDKEVRSQGGSGWTGWSAGNMELPLYHGSSMVWRRQGNNSQWVGVVAVNPGGMNYYSQPGLKEEWGHFNHPGNLCHTVGDLDEDGIDEVLVGREDGFLAIYNALTGEHVSKINLDDPIQALCLAHNRVIAGTDRRLVFLTKEGRMIAQADGGVESITQVALPDDDVVVVVGFSDGWIKGFRAP